ncbi:MAG: IS200/IS605 family transposase [Thermoplasmata archaeon]
MKTTRHASYNINYHIVWIHKYRKPKLKDKVKSILDSVLREIAQEKNIEMIDLEIQEDYIHLFVSAPPKYSPSLLVNWLKGISSRKFNHNYDFNEKLKWARGYYVGTAGKVSSETIKKYIRRQKN